MPVTAFQVHGVEYIQNIAKLSRRYMNNIGNRIKTLRGKANLSQTELGKKLFPGLTESASQARVARYETNKQPPSLGEAVAIADHFGVDLRWLVTGEQSESFQDAGWSHDLKSLCNDVRLIMESGDHVTAMALRQNIAAFKESVIRKTQIDGERENKGLASRKDPLSIPSPQDEEKESPGRKKAI